MADHPVLEHLECSTIQSAAASSSLPSLRKRLLACEEFGAILLRCKSGTSDKCEDRHFFEKLRADVENFNREYQRLVRTFVQHFTNRPANTSCFWGRRKGARNADSIEAAPGDSDASLALECYQSAQATLECLRRILTAYDAVCQSESGRQFYQDLVTGRMPNNDYSFSNAAILLELQSIYLLTPQGSHHMDFNTGGGFEGRFDAQESSRCFLHCDGNTPHCKSGCRTCNGDCSILPQHECPICMDVIYEALALECGHVFCATCALKAADKGRAVGTIRAILDHVDMSEACAVCRKKGVHAMARRLPITDSLLQQRYGFCCIARYLPLFLQ
ncbi:hypothetical protein CVIRNUC_003611 [Coccomyxa viridis]|uniref:RING-type domain-containing protein n=1 Tax=Coccomyxa viridis TaxID=1274662 RepID=A0AAV1HZ56_9CHLO|nr:hypothetical protein CVIRNUC_003611 [Coccomyxa viridis]